MTGPSSTLQRSRDELRKLITEAELLDADVTVLAKPLTPEEAIGTPGRRDFPILVGKERVLEATVDGAKGHAFTDSPREHLGTVREVLELELDGSDRRAVFVATLNAILRRLGHAEGTVHCRDDDPEQCGEQVAAHLATLFDRSSATVGLVGFNPALADHLVRAFSSARVGIVDLNPANIGAIRFGVTIGDGATDLAALIERADTILVTGTTLVNGTFDGIWHRIHARGKRGIVYGVTAAGVAALLHLERLCPCGRNG